MFRSVLALVVWFSVLAVGLRIDAATLGPSLLHWILFVVSSTVTNVGILALSAGMISTGPWTEALRRSFMIYVMLISGSVVLFTDSMSNPTPEQYGKMAGMVSVVCVLTAYRPELFDGFLDRMATLFRGPSDDVR